MQILFSQGITQAVCVNYLLTSASYSGKVKIQLCKASEIGQHFKLTSISGRGNKSVLITVVYIHKFAYHLAGD